MKLTLEGIKNREAWEKAGITLPGYDVEKVSEKARKEPEWVHFGIGNIFRIFIGGIADGLLEEGVLDRGITCVETFDYDVVDKIYDPYDNLGLSVILHGDGVREYKVLGSLAEAGFMQAFNLCHKAIGATLVSFITRPISLVLLIVCVASCFSPLMSARKKKKAQS